ncbi:MAG TPA: hypothetical protein VFS92_06120, partial [Planctomycetota bacterium]|nr:hypothetical protein [Planctomycetota bacterium]
DEASREAEASGSRSARSSALASRAAALVREKRGREALSLLDGATAEGLPPEVEAEVRLVALGALLEASGDARRIDAALEAAREAVERATRAGGDADLAVRLALGRAGRAEAAGDRSAAAAAYRDAAAAATADGRPPGGLLVDALRGLARATADRGEADRARDRAREAAEEVRARGSVAAADGSVAAPGPAA